jgi:predicted SnoaL-like aldol condensation-catalyzing enzyme
MKYLLGLALAALSILCTVHTARADMIPIEQAKAMCDRGDTGPRTVYGETKDEAAVKKIMVTWTCMTLVQGKVKEAFALYVSKDFCDHSHMANAGLKPCSNYDEVERMFTRMSVMMVHDGKIEFPTSAVVNGELVTQYGAGVDSWRVHDGKITDHWDASPAVAVTLSAHDKSFSDRMQKQIDLGVRLPGGPEGMADPTAAGAPPSK